MEVVSNSSFSEWIADVKTRICKAQIKASIAVNEEMLELYWNIGKDIAEKQFEKQ